MLGIQFGCLGLNNSNIYYSAKDNKVVNELISNSLFLGLIIFIFIIIIYFFSACFINFFPVSGLTLFLTLIWIPIFITSNLLQNLLLGINKVNYYNITELNGKILIFVTTFGLFFFNVKNLNLYLISNIISFVYSILFSIFYLKKCFYNYELKFYSEIFKKSIKYGILSYIACLFLFIINKVDIFFIKKYLGNEITGYYATALLIIDNLNLLSTVVGILLFPKLVKMLDLVKKWNYVKKISGYILLFNLLICIIIILFGDIIVKILFGIKFVNTVPIIICMLPNVILTSISNVFGNFITSIDVPKILLFFYFILMILNYYLNYYLILNFGIYGAISVSILTKVLIVIGLFLISKNIISNKVMV